MQTYVLITSAICRCGGGGVNFAFRQELGLTMLIKSAPDRYDKLRILGGMAAADDLLGGGQVPSAAGAGGADDAYASGPYAAASYRGKFASGDAASGPHRVAYSDPRKNPAPGIYRASLPNGKHINLMRVMFTDFCKMDCAYCPNSVYVPRKRFAFKREELAATFMELHQRLAVDGLFLSSGIAGDGSKTTQRLVETIELIRNKHQFKGYIHLKVMPGATRELVERAHKLGSRLSVNIETPEPEMMRRISPHKDLQKDILEPMAWINELTRQGSSGAVGQATQFVVGAADESDRQIYRRVGQLYADWNLKRVYYPPFRPGPAHADGGKAAGQRRPGTPPLSDGLAAPGVPLSPRRNRSGFRPPPAFCRWSKTPRRSLRWSSWTLSPST